MADAVSGPPATGPVDVVPPATGPVDGCDLCEAARITPWHHDDDVCWVADCEACDVPIVVWRRHGTDPDDLSLRHMLHMLGVVADARFGSGGWTLDRTMRQVPDHFHAHARDPAWWSRRFGGAGRR